MKRGREHARAAGNTLVANLHFPGWGRWAGLAALALALVAMPSGALALHYPTGSNCYQCHTLYGGAVTDGGMVPTSSYISPTANTIKEIMVVWDAAGGAAGVGPNDAPVPSNLGCTYCHSDSTRTGTMLDALSHFKSDVVNPLALSKHPIGRTFVGVKTETKNEYLATNGDAVVSTYIGTDEMECVDCHDPAQALYPTHAKSDATNNPYMLRGVGVTSTGGVQTYDALCRLCHAVGATFEGQPTGLTSHGDGSVAWSSTTANNSIAEGDLTRLKTTPATGTSNDQCTKCHDTHFSANAKLFNDGHEKSNGSTADAIIQAGSDCTTVCHYNGDEWDNFVDHGHGMVPPATTKTTLGFGCSNCHGLDAKHQPTRADKASNPQMLSLAVDPATSLLPPYKSLTSICGTCHSGYQGHMGSSAGCLDCHDEHAEGSGTTSNNFMIPEKLPNRISGTTETAYFLSAPADYFRGDANGMCDNAVCHAAARSTIVTTQPVTPLSTYLTPAYHPGGTVAVGAPCTPCHAHSDPTGSWSAKTNGCNCHGSPPISLATQNPAYDRVNEAKSPHERHAGPATPPTGGEPGYTMACAKCHNDYPIGHGTGGWGNVKFDATVNPTGAYVAGVPDSTSPATCSSLYCHSNGTSAAAVSGAVTWMTGFSTPDWSAANLTCDTCHGNGPSYANGTPKPNSHAKHAAYSCNTCHSTVVDSLGAIVGTALHANSAYNVAASASQFGLGNTPGFGSPAQCTSITCHSGNNATWGATLTCADCHRGTADVNNYVYGTAPMAVVKGVGEWDTTGHGRTTAYAATTQSGNPAPNVGGTRFATCTTRCHDSGVLHGVSTNPFRLQKPAFPVSGSNTYEDTADPQDDNNVCLDCHSNLGANKALATTYVDENHYGSKHTAQTKGGSFCWDCHDPHGDTEDFMIHGINGGAPGNGVTDLTDGVYGIPATSRPVTGFSVGTSEGGYTSADLANAANTGLCQTCHAASGGAAYYNRNLFTALASHNSADLQACTSCHQHTADFGAACDTCHGYPPPDSPWQGSTVTWTSDKAATPASVGEHATHVGGGYFGTGTCNTTCHVADTHLQNKTTANMGAMAGTPASSTGIFKYSTTNAFANWTNGGTAANTTIIDGTCANTTCHNSTYPVATPNSFMSAANPTYTRYWNQNYDCYACHAYNGSDSTLRPGVETDDIIATGSHGDHTNVYAMSCVECHPSGTYANNHKNGAVTFVTTFGQNRTGIATTGYYDVDGVAAFATWSGAPTEGGHAYYCVNVYCHSTGEPRGTTESVAYVNTTQWKTAASSDCGDCHGVNGTLGTMTTNVHEKHTATYAYGCVSCHANVVNASRAITSTALHVNGANNVQMAEGSYLTTGGSVAPVGGVCSATYCHSSGTSFTGGSYGAPTVEADWDRGDGGLTCAGCHGNGPAYTSGTPKANSHAAHASYACNTCHNTVVNASGAIISTTLHVNKAYNVAPSATQFVLGNAPNPTTPALCNTITCHNNGSATWGQSLDCTACHQGTADVNNYVYNTAPIAVIKGAGEWDTTGHGRTTAYAATTQSGNPAPNAGGIVFGNCTNRCHTKSVLHGVTNNPFRLRTAGGTVDFSDAVDPQSDNTVCLDCHSNTGVNKTQATTYVDDNHFGLKHAGAQTKGGSFCWDCHDPHGDTDDYMVHGTVGGAPGNGVTDVSDGIYGEPTTSRTVTGFLVGTSEGNYTSADLANAANTGLCQTCHATSGGAAWYNRNLFTPLASHNGADGQLCTGCHLHAEDFKGAGCNGCHGGKTNIPTAADNWWPDGNPTETRTGNTWADRSGAHLAHINAIGTARGWSTDAAKNAACVYCHPGSPPAGHPNDNASGVDQAEVKRMETTGDTVVDFWTTSYFSLMSGTAETTNGYYKIADNKCYNVACHGGAGTITPDWYNPVIPDTTPPTWSSGHPLTVTDAQSGGTLVINWSGANDQQSPPVRFDLFRDQDGVDVCGTGTLVGSNLSTGAYQDTGLTDGQTYHYCVLAKDQAVPPNTAPSTTPASGTPTAPPPPFGTPTGIPYYASWTAPPTTVDGASNPPTSATIYDLDTQGYGRKALLTATSTASRMYYDWQTQNTLFRRYARFYIDLTGTKMVGDGSAVTVTAGIRSNTATNQGYFNLVKHNPTGAADNGTIIATSDTLTTADTAATVGYVFTMTVPQTQIADTEYLVLEFMYKSGTSATSNRLYVGGNTGTTGTYFTIPVADVIAQETTPPVFNGPVTAVDAGTGGAVNLSWPAATDADGSYPIRYQVWWSSGAINYGSAPNAVTTNTSLTVTGLTDNILYNFGVKAIDSLNNLNNTARTATATPTGTPPPPTGCITCHGMWPQTSGAHAAHGATTDPQVDAAPCTKCHGDVSAYTTGHSNSVLNLPMPGDLTGPNAVYSGGTNGTCTTVSCHFDAANTPAWSTGSTVCTSCHGYPPVAAGFTNHGATTPLNIGTARILTAHTNCDTCHGASASNPTTGTWGTPVDKTALGGDKYVIGMNHGNGMVEMNGVSAPDNAQNVGYNQTTLGCDTASACHIATWKFNAARTNTVNLQEYGKASCKGCHDTGVMSAPIVSSSSMHVDPDGSGTTYAPGDCDGCHPAHTGGVTIPPSAGVGIGYTAHSGIHLGGTATSGATEAEICWNCHSPKGISEWGLNTDSNGTANNYNFGTISTQATTGNWIGAQWTSAQTSAPSFAFKTAAIQSTHTGNQVGTTNTGVQGVDTVGNIRCSYCHDVHNRNLALGDTQTGKPFLRGKWMGNPYKEDGPPRSGQTYTDTAPWGLVPRAFNTYNLVGGFFIDQNSGNPAGTWTASDSGGLCDLCHGTTKDGSFTATEIDALNIYGTAGVGWVSGLNGHKNSVLGASHNDTVAARNIFAGRGGANSQNSATLSHPFMMFNGSPIPGDASGGFRGSRAVPGYTPVMGTDPQDGGGWVNTGWNNIAARGTLDLTGATVNVNFHAFPCSKCHNPHASRLPRLLITNCLDTKHNTWDNTYQLCAVDSAAVNLNRSISNWSSAQNCHRLGGVDPDDTRGDVAAPTTLGGNKGWNTVSPW